MYLSKLTLRQFRSYDQAEFEFDEKLTLITGDNGSGKTNLLEAIYVLLQGGSFRVSDRELTKYDTDWWRVDGCINSDPRQIRYQTDHKPPKHLVEKQTTKRFTYKDRLPVVLFEPNDLLLLHGSPSRRRDAIDLMLSALSHPYKTTLSKYERALVQRNNILKKQPRNMTDALFSWDVLLSEYGVELLHSRRRLIEQLDTLLTGYYEQIAGSYTPLTILYQSDQSGQPTTSQYIQTLHKKLPLDTLRGTTSVGPHRDDIEFVLRDSSAKQSASRGETRTIILALKMAFAKLLESTYDTRPILLFDDVFSELDKSRRQNLATTLGNYQTIITDTQTVVGAEKQIYL